MTMKLFKSKAQFIWVRSLLFIVCILLVVVTILTTWMINSFTKELSLLNYNLTSLVQKSVDSRLEEIRNISTQIELSTMNLSLSKLKEHDKLDSLSHFSFANQISNYKLANLYIEDIYIYYPTIDYVVGDLGSFRANHYYILKNDLNSVGIDAWKETLQQRQNKNYYFDQNQLFFSRQLPYNELAPVEANITIEINKDEIMKLLERSQTNSDSSITALITPDNKVYAATGKNAEDVIALLPPNVFAVNEFVEYEHYFVFKRDSNISGLQYITIVNQDELLQQVYHTRNIVYVVIICCFIIGIVISIYMSRRNTKPLISLLNKLQSIGSRKEIGVDKLDEYQYIEHEIDLILNESSKRHIRLETQRDMIESLFLTNILSLELRSNQAIFSLMQKLDIEFPHPQFVVMLIRHLPDETLVQTIKHHTMPFDYIVTEFQDHLVLLIHFEQVLTTQQLKDWGEYLLAQLNHPPNTVVSFGGIYDALPDIVTSYHQARRIVETQLMQNKVLVYTITDVPQSTDLQFSSMMLDFNHYMDLARYEEASMLANAMMYHYVIHEEHRYLSRCRKYAIMNRIIDDLYLVAEKDHKFQVNTWLDQLSMSTSDEEMKQLILDVFEVLKAKQQTSTEKQSSNIAQRAKDIIDLKFTDPLIGLYSLSEQLNVTNTYLSKLFKDSYDYGLAQYINMKRIEQAKTLILTTSLSVKEISKQVGFSSDITFIRVFKQFTSTTPGKYKNK